MKKTAYILAAALLIGALSGCNSNTASDSDKKSEGGKVTQVAFGIPEEPDTTPEAVEYLKTQLPLFSKYLETRMQYPLTYETEVETDEGTVFASIYIKDEDEICFSSTDVNGNTTRSIYANDKVYMVIDEENVTYEGDTKDTTVKEIVENNLLKIDIAQAKALTYETSAEPVSYNDVLYKHEVIYTTPDQGVHYYYDVNTDTLAYVVSGNSATKVTKLNNEVTKEAFMLPLNNETKSITEYYQKMAEEAEASVE